MGQGRLWWRILLHLLTERTIRTLPKSDSVLFLENCNLDVTTLKGVHAWLASTALGKGKNKVIDTAAAEFVAACSRT